MRSYGKIVGRSRTHNIQRLASQLWQKRCGRNLHTSVQHLSSTGRRLWVKNTIALALAVAKVLGCAAKPVLTTTSVQRALLSWLSGILAALCSGIAIRRAAGSAVNWTCGNLSVLIWVRKAQLADHNHNFRSHRNKLHLCKVCQARKCNPLVDSKNGRGHASDGHAGVSQRECRQKIKSSCHLSGRGIE